MKKIFDIVKFAVQDVLRLNAANETLFGTDHAHYDWKEYGGNYTPINYDLAYTNGSRFAILKIVNGSLIQAFAAEEFARARTSKIAAIPYMWPYPIKNISAISQTAKYWEVMKHYPGVTIALDAEETPGYSNPQGSDHEAVIREYWKLVPNQKFLLYSNYHYINDNGFNTEFFSQFPLWLSRPGSYEPVVPSAWTSRGKTWTIWQNSWSADPAQYGVTSGKKAIDTNLIRVSEFESIFGVQFPPPVIPPPPEGETMITIATVASSVLNVRNTSDLTSTTNVIGPSFLRYGDIIYGVEKSSTSIRFTKARRAGKDLALPGPVCWCSLGTSYVRKEWDINAEEQSLPILHITIGADNYATKPLDLIPL